MREKASNAPFLGEDWFISRQMTDLKSLDTRTQLLIAAFEEIHEFGYQAASLSRILNRTGLTKGALYHHFPNKLELGYAVLDELIRYQTLEQWIKPLESGDPIEQLIGLIQDSGANLSLEDIRLGCPLGNLSQEMSAIDEGFRERIEQIYSEWRHGLSDALQRGQQAGQVTPDIDAESTAIFIIASLQGCLAAAKNAQSVDLLFACGCGLMHVLENMRIKEKNND